MSRYTIEDLYNSTYHVKGPDGLGGVGKISKRSEMEAKAEALIARIEWGTE